MVRSPRTAAAARGKQSTAATATATTTTHFILVVSQDRQRRGALRMLLRAHYQRLKQQHDHRDHHDHRLSWEVVVKAFALPAGDPLDWVASLHTQFALVFVDYPVGSATTGNRSSDSNDPVGVSPAELETLRRFVVVGKQLLPRTDFVLLCDVARSFHDATLSRSIHCQLPREPTREQLQERLGGLGLWATAAAGAPNILHSSAADVEAHFHGVVRDGHVQLVRVVDAGHDGDDGNKDIGDSGATVVSPRVMGRCRVVGGGGPSARQWLGGASYKSEGSMSMYTPEMIAQRRAIGQDAEVVSLLKLLWNCVVLVTNGGLHRRLDREAFVTLMINYQVLLLGGRTAAATPTLTSTTTTTINNNADVTVRGDASRCHSGSSGLVAGVTLGPDDIAAFRAQGEVDWGRDTTACPPPRGSSSAGGMCFLQFFCSVFEIVDTWCPSAERADYVALLATLVEFTQLVLQLDSGRGVVSAAWLASRVEYADAFAGQCRRLHAIYTDDAGGGGDTSRGMTHTKAPTKLQILRLHEWLLDRLEGDAGEPPPPQQQLALRSSSSSSSSSSSAMVLRSSGLVGAADGSGPGSGLTEEGLQRRLTGALNEYFQRKAAEEEHSNTNHDDNDGDDSNAAAASRLGWAQLRGLRAFGGALWRRRRRLRLAVIPDKAAASREEKAVAVADDPATGMRRKNAKKKKKKKQVQVGAVTAPAAEECSLRAALAASGRARVHARKQARGAATGVEDDDEASAAAAKTHASIARTDGGRSRHIATATTSVAARRYNNRPPPTGFEVGARVRVRTVDDTGTLWWMGGRVARRHGDGTYDVAYDGVTTAAGCDDCSAGVVDRRVHPNDVRALEEAQPAAATAAEKMARDNACAVSSSTASRVTGAAAAASHARWCRLRGILAFRGPGPAKPAWSSLPLSAGLTAAVATDLSGRGCQSDASCDLENAGATDDDTDDTPQSSASSSPAIPHEQVLRRHGSARLAAAASAQRRSAQQRQNVEDGVDADADAAAPAAAPAVVDPNDDFEFDLGDDTQVARAEAAFGTTGGGGPANGSIASLTAGSGGAWDPHSSSIPLHPPITPSRKQTQPQLGHLSFDRQRQAGNGQRQRRRRSSSESAVSRGSDSNAGGCGGCGGSSRSRGRGRGALDLPVVVAPACRQLRQAPDGSAAPPAPRHRRWASEANGSAGHNNNHHHHHNNGGNRINGNGGSTGDSNGGDRAAAAAAATTTTATATVRPAAYPPVTPVRQQAANGRRWQKRDGAAQTSAAASSTSDGGGGGGGGSSTSNKATAQTATAATAASAGRYRSLALQQRAPTPPRKAVSVCSGSTVTNGNLNSRAQRISVRRRHGGGGGDARVLQPRKSVSFAAAGDAGGSTAAQLRLHHHHHHHNHHAGGLSQWPSSSASPSSSISSSSSSTTSPLTTSVVAGHSPLVLRGDARRLR